MSISSNYTLNICPYTEISVVLTPHQGNFLLEQPEPIAENHKQPKYKVVGRSPNGYICKNASSPKTQGALQKIGWKDCKKQKLGKFIARYVS